MDINSPKIIEQDKTHKKGIIEKATQKFSSPSPPRASPRPKLTTPTTPKSQINELDIDIDTLPVIQGSFEVTKTEADITRNRESLKATSTLKPFMISPASIKVSEKRNQGAAIQIDMTDDKFGQQKVSEINVGKVEKTNKTVTPLSKLGTVVKTSTTTTTILPPTMEPNFKTNIGSTEKMIDTTVNNQNLVNENTAVKKQSPLGGMQSLKDLLKSEIVPQETSSTTSKSTEFIIEKQNITHLPQLDLNLFTNSPVIDDEPWHPMNPNTPKIEKEPEPEKHSVKKATPPTMNFKDELLLFRNKMPTLESIEQGYVDSSGGLIYYKSFNNPGFTQSTSEIEQLGAMDVRPYQLPVNKLTDELTDGVPEMTHSFVDQLNVSVNGERYEHLGGGVIVKKPEAIENNVKNISKVDTNLDELKIIESEEISDEDSDEVLNEKQNQEGNQTYVDENKLESRAGDSDIGGGSSEKLSFISIKDYVMQTKPQSTEKPDTTYEKIQHETQPDKIPVSIILVSTESTPTSTVDTSSVWEDAPQLFPIGSKWEFVNGTRVTPFENMGMRKVYNETLQALVVENSQLPIADGDFEGIKAQKPNVSNNLPGISSMFDTIASKLGIQPEIISKSPPFATLNKVKTTNAMITSTTQTIPISSTIASTTIPVPTTTTTRKPSSTTSTKKPSASSTKKPTTTPRVIYKQTTTTSKKPATTTTTRKTTTKKITTVQPQHITDGTFSSVESSSESMFMGEAEVEVVDPNAYEEILKQSQRMSSSTTAMQTTPRNTPLVTLLPVKSNSGIRNFSKEKLKHSPGIMQSTGGNVSSNGVSKKSFNSRGPIFAENIQESVVKMSMNVE